DISLVKALPGISDALEHAVYQIQNAPIREYPFPHLMVRDVFPADFYQDMVARIPSPEQFIRMRNSRHGNAEVDENRFFLSMNDKNFDTLPPDIARFWGELGSDILNGWFFRQMLAKLRPYCDKLRLALGRLEHECLLVSDRRNFVIKPHTDTPQKLFSLLFYLPRDGSLASCGTALYRQLDERKRYNNVDYFEFNEFQEVARAPFVPNTMFGFVRTKNSFHAVPQLETFGQTRNLLIFEAFAYRPF
ncbi:MAG: hypothetical protein WA738_11470, partial [Candidatus Angelobacter sp.]